MKRLKEQKKGGVAKVLKKEFIGFYLSADLAQAIRIAAAAEEIPVSLLMRRAIKAELARAEKEGKA